MLVPEPLPALNISPFTELLFNISSTNSIKSFIYKKSLMISFFPKLNSLLFKQEFIMNGISLFSL